MQYSPISSKETLYAMALTRMNYFNLTALRGLYEAAGNATAIMENRQNIRDILPDASPRLVEQLLRMDEPLRRAEAEMEYDAAHGITPLTISDDRYPQRLRECDDAPLVLFYKGSAELNQQRVISIVATDRIWSDVSSPTCDNCVRVCSWSADWPTALTSMPIVRLWRRAMKRWVCWLTDWTTSIRPAIGKRPMKW